MPNPMAIEDYLRAVYTLTHEGQSYEFTFVPASLSGAGPTTIDVPRPLAIISACNPMSVRVTDAENEARTHELASILQRACIPRGPASGRAPDGTWMEPGRVVFGLGRADVLAYARRFSQRAVVWGSDSSIGILDCLTERLIIRPVSCKRLA